MPPVTFDISKLASLLPVASAVLAPGYVWLKSEERVMPGPKRAIHEQFFEYVVYSMVLYCLWFAVISWLDLSVLLVQIDSLDSSLRIALLASPLLAVAWLAGTAWGVVRRQNLIGRTLDKLKIPNVHPVESGWQKAFMRPCGCVVRVSLIDAKSAPFFAIYCKQSIVSCEAKEGDLFFERMLIENDTGQLIEDPLSAGIWIDAKNVQSIRFYNVEDLVNDSRANQQPSSDDEINYKGTSAALRRIAAERSDDESPEARDSRDPASLSRSSAEYAHD